MGLPLVHDRDHDGVNLPRRTPDLAASGPGVVVARAMATAPSLAGVRVGDAVFFDATEDDADGDGETDHGVIDHVGVCMGEDQYGDLRFLSSRKTPNGPTSADLGGASTLNGTGLYAPHAPGDPPLLAGRGRAGTGCSRDRGRPRFDPSPRARVFCTFVMCIGLLILT